ncbi:MAG: helix-turn-helix domain-containing protein [Candidatus Parvarchaeota archaeon]|nr:helix-turn-helix domain-containing protein [Candidatus Parvarchaeum tengchongense]
MKSARDRIINRIIEVLKNSQKPLSQTQISQITKVNKATISKYVAILQAEGKIEIEKYGNVNLVRLKK